MKQVLSVTEINKYINEIISKDIILSRLFVKGEISNFKHHYSGHMYFTLKDENSSIKCVMFRNSSAMLKFKPSDGMLVILRGYISVFERDGQYQLYAEDMQPDGIGGLHLAFEQLKKKLSQEGLFDPANKKPLPVLPKSIGVITSSTGAVIRDIINVLSRRYPNFNLKIFNVPVQGEGACKYISNAIEKLNKLDCVEVIIIARGGGSIEDLWPFNEEMVARSVFNSKLPIISAVGHDTDYTICDFVADMRAPTPSAAAELVLPEKVIIQAIITNSQTRMKNAIRKQLKVNSTRIMKAKSSIVFKQPLKLIYQRRQELDNLTTILHKHFASRRIAADSRLAIFAARLDALSPLKVLSRGFSITKSSSDNKIIKSISQVSQKDKIIIQLDDGELDCVVNEIKGGAK